MSFISTLSKLTLLFCIGLVGLSSPANGQARDADFYRVNVPSSPLLININMGTATRRPQQSLANASHGTIVSYRSGCIRQVTGRIEVVDKHTLVTIGIGSIDSRDNILYLPNGSHGYLPLQCSAPNKVAMIEVNFADGGQWSIKSN